MPAWVDARLCGRDLSTHMTDSEDASASISDEWVAVIVCADVESSNLTRRRWRSACR